MLRVTLDVIDSLLKLNIDARSPRLEFDQALINQRVLSDYPGNYAKDHHYKLYGFNFIKTDEDAETFLQKLDFDNSQLDTTPLFKWGCTKAKSIRHGMKEPWTFTDNLSQFKALASSARRTCCSCHKDCSFEPI